MSATLDQVLADVTAETTLVGSLQTFVQGLEAQIANIGLSPSDQAKVDQIFAGLEANKVALAAIQNTPASNSSAAPSA